MNQNSLIRRFFVIALLLTLSGLLMAPGTTHAEENGDAPLDLNDLKSIDEVDSINTYRAHLSVNVSGEVFEEAGMAGESATFTLDGEFIKNPLAQRIIMSMNEGEISDEIEVIIVDGRSFIKIDGQWEETASPVIDSSEMTDAINQTELPDIGDLFKSVGTETVNGRQTIHYRADKESLALATIDDPQAQQFLANAEEAQIDIWVDQSEKFIVKAELVLAGKGFDETNPNASGRIEGLLEFYDFNAPVTITAPEVPKLELHIGPDALPIAKEILDKSQVK
jgi:hypothetical protein